MKFNANRHSDGEQERPHEDVGVQRQASLFFYGEGGSEKPPLPKTNLSGNCRSMSRGVLQSRKVVDACTTRGVDRAAAFAWKGFAPALDDTPRETVEDMTTTSCRSWLERERRGLLVLTTGSNILARSCLRSESCQSLPQPVLQK